MSATSRCDALAVVAWDAAHTAAFLHMQFAAQHQFYQEHYTETDFLIILRDAGPVGRLYIARRSIYSPVEQCQPAWWVLREDRLTPEALGI